MNQLFHYFIFLSSTLTCINLAHSSTEIKCYQCYSPNMIAGADLPQESYKGINSYRQFQQKLRELFPAGDDTSVAGHPSMPDCFNPRIVACNGSCVSLNIINWEGDVVSMAMECSQNFAIYYMYNLSPTRSSWELIKQYINVASLFHKMRSTNDTDSTSMYHLTRELDVSLSLIKDLNKALEVEMCPVSSPEASVTSLEGEAYALQGSTHREPINCVNRYSFAINCEVACCGDSSCNNPTHRISSSWYISRAGHQTDSCLLLILCASSLLTTWILLRAEEGSYRTLP